MLEFILFIFLIQLFIWLGQKIKIPRIFQACFCLYVVSLATYGLGVDFNILNLLPGKPDQYTYISYGQTCQFLDIGKLINLPGHIKSLTSFPPFFPAVVCFIHSLSVFPITAFFVFQSILILVNLILLIKIGTFFNCDRRTKSISLLIFFISLSLYVHSFLVLREMLMLTLFSLGFLHSQQIAKKGIFGAVSEIIVFILILGVIFYVRPHLSFALAIIFMFSQIDMRIGKPLVSSLLLFFSLLVLSWFLSKIFPKALDVRNILLSPLIDWAAFLNYLKSLFLAVTALGFLFQDSSTSLAFWQVLASRLVLFDSLFIPAAVAFSVFFSSKKNTEILLAVAPGFLFYHLCYFFYGKFEPNVYTMQFRTLVPFWLIYILITSVLIRGLFLKRG